MAAVTPIVEFPAVEAFRNNQREAPMAGIDPAIFERTGSLIFAAGDRSSAFAALRAGGAVLVPDPIASRDNIKVGDTLQLALPAQRTTAFKVAGIVAYSIPSASGEGDLLISLADAKTDFGRDEASLWALVPKAGVNPDAFRSAVAASAKDLAATPISSSISPVTCHARSIGSSACLTRLP